MVTNTDSIKTTGFDGDPGLRELFILLEGARDARTPAHRRIKLRQLSEKAAILAEQQEGQGS